MRREHAEPRYPCAQPRPSRRAGSRLPAAFPPLTRAIALAIVILALGAAETFAAAPNALTYQGQLQESGAAVTGARDVEIKLCDAATAGTCASTGVQSSVPVSQGLFRVTYSIPAGVDLTTGAWWLELWVGPAGGARQAFSPREQLTSGAYYLYASSAAALEATAGGVMIATAVAIGTAAPAALLDVQGTAYLRQGFQLGVSSSACTRTAAGTVEWTGSGFQFCDGTAWNPIIQQRSCTTGWFNRDSIYNLGGRMCCPAGTVMVAGGATGYYYSMPIASCDASSWGVANGLIGWLAKWSFSSSLGISISAAITCCSQ